MLSFIVKGFVIGVLVSAPLGPSGVLCIQRTLSKGRLYGLITGLGVACSDLVYALITGLGMSFVTLFIENNELPLKIIGSLVMLGFGIYLFTHNPVHTLQSKAREIKDNYTQQFLSGFFLTLSNVFIIFLFIGLYSRFGYFTEDYPSYKRILGYFMIFFGAIFWWFVITYLISRIKEHYNIRNIWVINKTTGTILITVSVIGLLNAFGIIYSSQFDKFFTFV